MRALLHCVVALLVNAALIDSAAPKIRSDQNYLPHRNISLISADHSPWRAMHYIVNEAGHMLRRVSGEHISNAAYNYRVYCRKRDGIFLERLINFASLNAELKFDGQRFVWENSEPVPLISYWPGEQLIANSILLLNNPHVVFHQRHSTANFDIESGQMSVVVQNELYGEGSSRLDILEIADWRWVTSRDPRSLVIFHDAQLSTHGLNLVRCLLVSAAQAAPLQQGSSETQKTYYDQKPSGPNKPSGYRYEWGFVGTLIIGLGRRFCACLWSCSTRLTKRSGSRLRDGRLSRSAEP